MHVTSPPVPSLLLSTSIRVFSSSPTGWGFTGSVGIQPVDENGCPTGSPMAQVPWLPEGPFDTHLWSVPISTDFAVVYTFSVLPSIRYSLSPVGTDHPSAGPTGPPACGLCYPVTRPNHSYQWGSVAAPNCPGIPFFDGLCDAQLRLDISLCVPRRGGIARMGRGQDPL